MSLKLVAQRRFFTVAKIANFSIFGKTWKNSLASLPFSEKFINFSKKLEIFRKSGNTGLQQENSHKIDDFAKNRQKINFFP